MIIKYTFFFTEISEFYLNAKETEEITLSKFHTERNIIQDLDLTPFPAKIKLSNVPLVYTSLLKVLFFYSPVFLSNISLMKHIVFNNNDIKMIMAI